MMAEGRSRAEWGRTSSLLALIANCHRDPKKTRAYRPADFDPHAARRERPVSVERLTREIIAADRARRRQGRGK